MNKIFWDKRRGVIHSKVGGWRIGEAVYTHGYSLIDDLVGKVSYFQILILNITGKLPEPRLAKWFEAAFSCMSFPDARIWCNQIGSLGGSTRAAPSASITAGILASDSRMYGPGTALSVYNFISKAMKDIEAGISPSKIVLNQSRRAGIKPEIPGYGRPLATGDERVTAIRKISIELGYEWGPHMQLVLNVEKIMQNTYSESMNLATFIVAFLCDQGWNVEQIRQITSMIVTAGVMACYSEAYNKPPESFLPLRCDDIEYTGPAARPVPIDN